MTRPRRDDRTRMRAPRCGTSVTCLSFCRSSAAVVVLTVLKVFFIDMEDLTGLYQALSFIGLGAVLIGIGWFYQRLLFPRAAVSPHST